MLVVLLMRLAASGVMFWRRDLCQVTLIFKFLSLFNQGASELPAMELVWVKMFGSRWVLFLSTCYFCCFSKMCRSRITAMILSEFLVGCGVVLPPYNKFACMRLSS